MQYPAESTEKKNKEDLFKTQQQLSHDLRAPISALLFVASLNPDMPKDSAQLLKSAIERLKEITDKLESKI